MKERDHCIASVPEVQRLKRESVVVEEDTLKRTALQSKLRFCTKITENRT